MNLLQRQALLRQNQPLHKLTQMECIMGKKKTKYVPFEVFEYEHMESWLEDLAGKGWMLNGMFACFATFEECKPRKLRYRIVPTAGGKATDEEIAFYEESGWKFAGSARGLNVFCCEDPGAPELFTDRQSFSKRARGYMIGALFSVLAFAYLLWINLSNGVHLFSFDGGFLHGIHDMGVCTFAALSILIVLAVIVSIRAMVKYARHVRRISGGKPLYKGGSFRGIAVLNKTIMLTALVCVILLIIGWADKALTFSNVPANQNTHHPAGVAQVDPEFSEAIDTVLGMRAEGLWPEDYDYDINEKHTLLFTDLREVLAQYDSESDINLQTGALQKHNNPDGTPILSETRYYRAIYAVARTESIAARFLAEEKYIQLDADEADLYGADEKEVPVPGLDQAIYLQTHDISPGYQYLFLRRGRNIEIIHYQGPEDLKEHADEISLDLSSD